MYVCMYVYTHIYRAGFKKRKVIRNLVKLRHTLAK